MKPTEPAVSNGRGAWRQGLPLHAILLLTFLLHLLVLGEPFGRDQGIFAYIGDTLLRGGVPYRDAWDHKTPGVYAVYALAFVLFGRVMPSLHLVEGLVLTVTAFFVYQVGRRAHSDGVGLLGALLYGVGATLLFEWWDRGQAEVYMGLTGTLAVYCLLLGYKRAAPSPSQGEGRGEGRLLALALSGVFCGLTVYFKPSGLPLAAGLGLVLLVLFWRGGLRRTVGAALAFGVGFALSFLPLLAYFAVHGALDDLVQTVIVFNTYHARIGGNPTLAGSIAGTLDFLTAMNILAPLAMVGLWLSIQVTARAGLRPAPAAAVLPIWLLASAAGIWTQGKFFSYHWSPVLPPLALLAAWGATSVGREVRQIRSADSRVLMTLLCVIVVGVYALSLARDHAPKWIRDAGYLLGRTSEDAYLANFGHDIQGRDKYSFLEARETARYLQAHSEPNDYVLIWGFQALVNVLADRRAPTRYIFTYPLTFDRPESAFRVQARRTFLRDLQERPPLYIVLVTNDVNPLQAVDSYELLAGFPEFQRLLEQHYRIETSIGEFHLYRRINA